jgi:glycosyltransferase involved in cell wall biosynthesis
VVTTRAARGPLLEALLDGGVRHVGLERHRRFDLRGWWRLARLLRSERPEILHAHKFGSNIWGVLIGRACRVPVVIAHEHTWSYEGNPLRRFLDGRVIGRLADAFVAVSTEDERRMIAVEHVPAGKIRVLLNAFVDRPWAANGDVRAELGLAPDTPLVGAAVMLRPQKALEVLVEAFAHVREVQPDAHLVLAGEGPERARIERAIAEHGVGASAHMLGAREDAVSIIRQLDVAALSSDFEGTPLYAFECMAQGTPLVATGVGGVPDVVEDGVSAVLVPPRDPDALARGITGILTDPQRRDAIVTGAHARLQNFTVERVTARLAAIYEEQLERARR